MKKPIAIAVLALVLSSCALPDPIRSSSAGSSDVSTSDTGTLSSSSSESSSSSSSSSSSPISYEIKEAPLYTPTYREEEGVTPDYYRTDSGTMNYIVDPDIGANRPLVSFSSIMGAWYEDPEWLAVEGVYESDALTYTFPNKETLVFDFSKGIATASNASSISIEGELDYPMDFSVSYSTTVHTERTGVNFGTSKPTVFDLGSYDIPTVYYEGDLYLPTIVGAKILSYYRSASLAYNGAGFYYIGDPSVLNNYSASDYRSEYARHYYEESTMASLSQKTEAEAKLDGDTFLFLLDHLYGFVTTRTGMEEGYGPYLKTNYPDVYSALYGTDPAKANWAYDQIILLEMGDGHSSVYGGSYGAIGSFYNEGKYTHITERSERYSGLNEKRAACYAARKSALGLDNESVVGDQYVEIKGETAIIRFDVFNPMRLAPGLAPEEYEQAAISGDTFSVFYSAFRAIDAAETVKNVVVDVTCNGGGNTAALGEALGFVLDNPTMGCYDVISDSVFEGVYRTDWDADGVYSAENSPASRYTMYVMTSNFSFSCANAFPHYAQVGGVKIIGMQSGGGAFAVLPIVLSDGFPIRISGPLEIGRHTLDDETIDGGVPVDIAISDVADFYSIDKIAELIP